MNLKIRQPEELSDVGAGGKPSISLDRAAATVLPGATNDAILEKRYRNQRDALVCAHALGFGIYGNIVQLLESAEHWKDVSCDVPSGKLIVGQQVNIVRPGRNSPVHPKAVPHFL